MPTIVASFEGRSEKVEFCSEQKSIKQLLDTTKMRVRSACRGIGACGLCRIKITDGEWPEPTDTEKYHIQEEELQSGVRLACCVHPAGDMGDMKVEILSLAPISIWHSDMLDGSLESFQPDSVSGHRQNFYKVAVDIGTTKISIAIIDEKGRIIGDRLGYNPQFIFGSDVVTRIQSAVEDTKSLHALWSTVVAIVYDGISDIARREGIDTKRIVECHFVGNTAMLTLLAKKNYHMLALPKYWQQRIDITPDEAVHKQIKQSVGLGEAAKLFLWEPFGGFIGSDIAAGIVHTKLESLKPPAMLIDFGTNSEIAVWDGSKLFLASAAGGPAFEAAGISCGLPAQKGAIYKTQFSSGQWCFEVIGEAEPLGICGSGLVDIISELIENGELKPDGNFANGSFLWDLPILGKHLFIGKKDIDLFQRAKAAIAAATIELCHQAGIDTSQFETLVIAGVFGKFLNVANSVKIGLLPPVKNAKVIVMPSSALLGCIDLAQSQEAREVFAKNMQNFSIINLSSCEDFEDIFLNNLYLTGMRD